MGTYRLLGNRTFFIIRYFIIRMLSISLRSEADAVRWLELHVYSLYFSIGVGFAVFWWLWCNLDQRLKNLKHGHRRLSESCQKQNGALCLIEKQIRWIEKRQPDWESSGTQMGESASQTEESEEDGDECSSVSSGGSDTSAVSTETEKSDEEDEGLKIPPENIKEIFDKYDINYVAGGIRLTISSSRFLDDAEKDIVCKFFFPMKWIVEPSPYPSDKIIMESLGRDLNNNNNNNQHQNKDAQKTKETCETYENDFGSP